MPQPVATLPPKTALPRNLADLPQGMSIVRCTCCGKLTWLHEVCRDVGDICVCAQFELLPQFTRH